jgi:hypothetical protein
MDNQYVSVVPGVPGVNFIFVLFVPFCGHIKNRGLVFYALSGFESSAFQHPDLFPPSQLCRLYPFI